MLNAARETRALGFQASSMSGAAQCSETYQLLALGGLSEEEVDGLFIGNGTDSKNLFIGQYDKFFEEYWLSPIF